MIRLIQAELLKLKRSLTVLLMLSVPSMVFIIGAAVTATGNGPSQWNMAALSGAAIWSYFLLPMTATALTALMAQLEHGSGGWSYSLALPSSKVSIFLAKAIIAVAAMFIVASMVGVANIAGISVGVWLSPEYALEGDYPWGLAFATLGKMGVAGLLVVAIQFAVAMRYESFAVPVVVGIAGTFVAIVATSAKQGLFFPWLMATNVMNTTPAKAELALWFGGVGGLIVFGVSILWLARRDWI